MLKHFRRPPPSFFVVAASFLLFFAMCLTNLFLPTHIAVCLQENAPLLFSLHSKDLIGRHMQDLYAV